MDFGIHIVTRGCLTSREAISAVATAAEASGYAIFGVADHVIVPAQSNARYPYTKDGVWPGAATADCLDTLGTLAFLAGITQRMKLLTSVLVVPYRPAVLTAKLFTTIDVLSGGRAIAGIGSGWMREEFEALETPPFEARGAVTDEWIQAWKALWTQDRPSFEGTYVRFRDVLFRPGNVTRPHPPVWVGGESAPAIRRAAALGDGWYPVSNNPNIPLDSPARFAEGIGKLHRAAEKIGRDPASIEVSYVWLKAPSWTAVRNADGAREMFTGSRDDMLEDAAALAALGVKHLIIYPQQPSVQASLDTQQRFAEDVIRNS